MPQTSMGGRIRRTALTGKSKRKIFDEKKFQKFKLVMMDDEKRYIGSPPLLPSSEVTLPEIVSWAFLAKFGC